MRTSDDPKWTAQSGGNRGEDGVGNSGKGQMCTPDGPKWTARSVRGSGWGGEKGGGGVKNYHSRRP